MKDCEKKRRKRRCHRKKDFLPVYREPLTYARDNGEIDPYRVSRRENIACKEAIEKSIADHFDGMRFDPAAAKEVLEEAGIVVEPVRVIALFDHNRRNHTDFPSNICSSYTHSLKADADAAPLPFTSALATAELRNMHRCSE